jgi:hypothetical protein
VPTVADPVDLGSLSAKPCDALSITERESIGLLAKEGQETRDSEGRLICLWSGKNPSATFMFIPYADKPILRDVYASAPTISDLARFTTYSALNRFPAAMTTDERSSVCMVTVAISDNQGFQFREDTGDGQVRGSCSRPADATLSVLGKLIG